MLTNEDIITRGYNKSIKLWTENNYLLYSTSLKKELVSKISSTPLPSMQIPYTGLAIGKKLFKKYNINTLLVKIKPYDETKLF